MSSKLLTPTEISAYACEAIIEQLCDGRTPAEACIDRPNWNLPNIAENLYEFFNEEFFWDHATISEHVIAVLAEMSHIADIANKGLADIEQSFINAGAPEVAPEVK